MSSSACFSARLLFFGPALESLGSRAARLRDGRGFAVVDFSTGAPGVRLCANGRRLLDVDFCALFCGVSPWLAVFVFRMSGVRGSVNPFRAAGESKSDSIATTSTLWQRPGA